MKRIPVFWLLPLCLSCFCVNAQQGGDFQAQILYAFYSEDSNALASVAQILTTQAQAQAQAQPQADGVVNARRYHLAHANYRLGLLAAHKHSRAADAAFAECVNELKPILEQEGNSVEVLALQSACYSNLAHLRHAEALVLRSRADDRMRRALKMEPRNPRVELLRAEADVAGATLGPAELARALGELLAAAQVFDQSSTTTVNEPGRGHAETYLLLGKLFEFRGDFLDARNWLEKALIVAPDYKAAQRQLAGLVSHLSATEGAAAVF